MKQADWIANLEYYAEKVAEAYSQSEVDFILEVKGHGARSIQTLCPVYYDAVFDDLFQRIVDYSD